MSNYNGCMACSPNPNIIALRAAYLSAEAELEKWKGEVRHSEARALAAERARDEAVREGAEYANRLDGWRVKAGDYQRERDEAVAARTALFDALVLLVEWGARGHNPNDIAPWIRATQVLKDARLAASTGEGSK